MSGAEAENMRSGRDNGRAIANQFIITEQGRGALGNFTKRETFQSYSSVIAIRTCWPDGDIRIELDKNMWDYSSTTGIYRNMFLDESKKETEKKIADGTYKLVALNH